MTSWNYAEVWETIAAAQPEAPAIIQGESSLSWGDLDRRATNIGSWLLSLGASHQDKVALYLYNGPEYLEGMYASLKVGLVPVNTNYRYGDEELAYLWDNADAIAVIFHGTFTDRIEGIRGSMRTVKGWLWVDDGSGPCPTWASPYEAEAEAPSTTLPETVTRSPDDLIMLYTGGTTGMPKGVMWRQDDLFARLNANATRRWDPEAGLEAISTAITEHGPGMALLPACPLMHGTGMFTAIECLAEGGRVVLLASRHYDPAELAQTIDDEQVNLVVIVGDPFARPLLTELQAHPDRYSMKSVVAITSSGAMWSEEIKHGLLEHHDGMLLMDMFSSSEALGMGASISAAGSEAKTGDFTLGPEVRVLDDENKDVEPGSDVIGVLALGGRNPLGYYKDEAKSEATFRIIDGKRLSVPGDFAKVRADGSIHLLGRGSQCINTAGEKVYPEEVEEVLKRHDAVADACVVGVPDERTGERVVAAVELTSGASAPAESDLISHVRSHLAHYKSPRQIKIVDSIGRAANGKMDYKRHKAEAIEWAGGS